MWETQIDSLYLLWLVTPVPLPLGVARFMGRGALKKFVGQGEKVALTKFSCFVENNLRVCFFPPLFFLAFAFLSWLFFLCYFVQVFLFFWILYCSFCCVLIRSILLDFSFLCYISLLVPRICVVYFCVCLIYGFLFLFVSLFDFALCSLLFLFVCLTICCLTHTKTYPEIKATTRKTKKSKTMRCVAFAALTLLPVAFGGGGAEGDSNTDIEFVQRQLTGLYTVSPTIGDTNGGQCIAAGHDYSGSPAPSWNSVLLYFKFRACKTNNLPDTSSLRSKNCYHWIWFQYWLPERVRSTNLWGGEMKAKRSSDISHYKCAIPTFVAGLVRFLWAAKKEMPHWPLCASASIFLVCTMQGFFFFLLWSIGF